MKLVLGKNILRLDFASVSDVTFRFHSVMAKEGWRNVCLGVFL